MSQHSLKPTAVASGSEQIAKTARWRNLLPTTSVALSQRVKVMQGRVYPKIRFELREGVTL